jgi:hypothetical protein
VFLMRGEEIRKGIDVYPVQSEEDKEEREKEGSALHSLGKSKKAATLAVGETALSRVLNATPVMAIPPLILVRLQQTEWLRRQPRLTLPVNLGMCNPFVSPTTQLADCDSVRPHFDHVDIRITPSLGRIPSEASCRCSILGGAILEQGRQRQQGRVQ